MEYSTVNIYPIEGYFMKSTVKTIRKYNQLKLRILQAKHEKFKCKRKIELPTLFHKSILFYIFLRHPFYPPYTFNHTSNLLKGTLLSFFFLLIIITRMRISMHLWEI